VRISSYVGIKFVFCVVFSITLFKISFGSLTDFKLKKKILIWLRLFWVEEKCDFCKRKKKWWYFYKPCRVSFLLPTSFSLSLQLFYLCQDINSQKNKTSVVSGFQIQLSLALRCQAYLLFLLHPSSTVISLFLSLFLCLSYSLSTHMRCALLFQREQQQLVYSTSCCCPQPLRKRCPIANTCLVPWSLVWLMLLSVSSSGYLCAVFLYLFLVLSLSWWILGWWVWRGWWVQTVVVPLGLLLLQILRQNTSGTDLGCSSKRDLAQQVKMSGGLQKCLKLMTTCLQHPKQCSFTRETLCWDLMSRFSLRVTTNHKCWAFLRQNQSLCCWTRPP